MSSLLDLLTQKQPQFQTHQALIVLDLQNDFLLPDGKLPVSSRSGFLSRIRRLVPTFRDNAGDVIWVRTVHEQDRSANDGTDDGEVVITSSETETDGRQDEDAEDGAVVKEAGGSPGSASKTGGRGLELLKKITRKQSTPTSPVKVVPEDEPELFLSSSITRKPCFLPNTKGVEFYDEAKRSIDLSNDVVVTKSHYSAFNSTQLLTILRIRLITELYICGCMTNLSVYATALDAARHGLTINIVDDCLGFRKAGRHREALRQMADVMGAYRVSSTELLTELAEQDPDANIDTSRILSPEPTGRLEPEPFPDSPVSHRQPEVLHDLVEKLRLSDASSAVSAKDERQNRSLEILRPGSRTADIPARPAEHSKQVRRKPSGKLQKKPPASPVSQDAGSNDVTAEEAAERSLKYRRSKIRMRKREPSAGPHDRVRAPDGQSQPEPVPDNSKQSQSRLSDQPISSPRASSEQPVTSSLPSPSPRVSYASEISDVHTTPNRIGSIATSDRDSSAIGASVRSDNVAQETSEVQSPLLSPTNGRQDVPRKAQPTPKPANSGESRRTPSDATPSAQSLASAPSPRHSSSAATLATPKTSEVTIGEGDSYLATSILPSPQDETIFSDLYNEVRWQNMYHQTGAVPRLVCVQGDFGTDGSMPIYRHPTDNVLPLLHYSPAVEMIRKQAERIVRHPLNHCLIQLYRSGQDYITEHSDKTLDIMRGSSIVNASFGAQRTMRLRTKKSALDQQSISFADAARQTHRVPLPHNSAFVLGQDTNMRWLHGITADKRLPRDRSDAEKAFSGMRISLTFRHIGTFLNPDSTLIWGQGATSKRREGARPAVNNDVKQTEALVRAFGQENQATEFDWAKTYGCGFDVLNFRNTTSDKQAAALLFFSNDAIENGQIRTYLDEAGVDHVSLEAPTKDADDKMGFVRKICFRDSDPLHTEITGALAVLLYLDRFWPLPHRVTADGADDKPVETRATTARTYELLNLLTEAVDGVRKGEKWLLGSLEGHLNSDGYVTGKNFGLADCAFHPVLERCWEGWDEQRDGEVPRVKAYIERVRSRLASRDAKEK